MKDGTPDQSNTARPSRLRGVALVATGAVLLSSAMLTPRAQDDGQPQPACAGPEYRQFDFWLGEWAVTSEQGSGHNSIAKALDGCVITESWQGSSGYRGQSLNFYDAARRRWHQTWIDNGGQPLIMEGGLEGESMVMTGTTGEGAALMHHRTTWTPLDDGTLRQHWEQSSDGKEWQTFWYGTYEKAPQSP